MIGAVIYYGKNTLVAELPMGTLDLQMKLSSIGVGEPADRIPLKDDEERQLQVKLYASSPEEAHLLSLLTPEHSLANAFDLNDAGFYVRNILQIKQQLLCLVFHSQVFL